MLALLHGASVHALAFILAVACVPAVAGFPAIAGNLAFASVRVDPGILISHTVLYIETY